MQNKFAAWAREVGVPTQEDWTVEQICDALVEANAKWPPDLINEEGWQLWTAVMRRELGCQSIQWDEISGGEDQYAEAHTLEVTFRLNDSREHKITLAKSVLKQQEFGAICHHLELQVREWKAMDDKRREGELKRSDEEWAGRAPDVMDYVVGFRAWVLKGPRIAPIGAGNDIWKGGQEIRAECAKGELHRAPAADCECGLYAWNDFEPMRKEAGGGTERVWGAVKACGRIQVHKTGFRAEYMQPIALGYDDSKDQVITDDSGLPVDVKRGPDYERVRAIAEQLGGIEVVPFDVLEEAAKEHGRLLRDCAELRP